MSNPEINRGRISFLLARVHESIIGRNKTKNESRLLRERLDGSTESLSELRKPQYFGTVDSRTIERLIEKIKSL